MRLFMKEESWYGETRTGHQMHVVHSGNISRVFIDSGLSRDTNF